MVHQYPTLHPSHLSTPHVPASPQPAAVSETGSPPCLLLTAYQFHHLVFPGNCVCFHVLSTPTTRWRQSGKMRDMPKLVSNGSHDGWHSQAVGVYHHLMVSIVLPIKLTVAINRTRLGAMSGLEY